MKLIDKNALVAEITKIYDRNRSNGYIDVCDEIDDILSFIDTLEVKEVDLESEMDKFYGIYRKNGITYDKSDNEACFDWKDELIKLAKSNY